MTILAFPRLKNPALFVASFALAMTVAGCAGPGETTASISGAKSTAASSLPSRQRTETEWRQLAAYWGGLYDKDPKNPGTALNYATALRGLGQRAQAVALLQQAAINHPNQPAILAAYGRALADAGNYTEALKVLERAHQPERPDWRILNAQGAILDQMGRFADARRYYETALKTAPGEPAILSNYGLSYALSENLPEAEKILRQAAQTPGATPKVRQNLVLVLSLQGKFKEAETLARQDLSPEAARENVAYWKQAMTQRDRWKSMGASAPAVANTAVRPSVDPLAGTL
jgi:Flp pilus assembly protein TadD